MPVCIAHNDTGGVLLYILHQHSKVTLRKNQTPLIHYVYLQMIGLSPNLYRKHLLFLRNLHR